MDEKEYRKKYYAEHKEECAAYARKYYQENKEKYAAYRKKHYETHPEYYKNYRDKYNKEHKEERKQHYLNNKEKYKAASKKYYNEHKDDPVFIESNRRRVREYAINNRELINAKKRQYIKDHREKYNAEKNKYYRERAIGCERHHWDEWEDELVMEHSMTDTELSKKIKHSVKAIQGRRHRLKKLYGEGVVNDCRRISRRNTKTREVLREGTRRTAIGHILQWFKKHSNREVQGNG